MIVEWFTTWVLLKGFGFLVKTIISQDFVEELVKDYAKDFFKNVLSNAVTAPFKREPLEKAVVMALSEFLQLMQQDLEDGELSENEIKKYAQPIKKFLKHLEVKAILGNAFKNDQQTIDTSKLLQIWYQVNPDSSLPDDFNWKRVGKKYVQKVKAIILEIPELREILDSKNLDKIRENTTETAGIIPAFDLERYQEGICECYGNLKLDSLDTSGYAYNELKLWRMFIAQNVRETDKFLPQIHELPKEHYRRLHKNSEIEAELQAEELERHKRVYLEQPILSVLDVIQKKQNYKYIVILGDPGSGKSTLLQFLALNWAETPLDNVISRPIPLLIELRTYMRRREDQECNNFLEFFHKCSGAIHHLNQHQLNEQLNSGNALVMFDGLDEVFDPGKREDVITDIHRFTNQYPNVQVIVTSRIIGYKPQKLRDAEFRHFILQDLEPEQIQDFIHRWHELTFSDEADKARKRERLQRGIETSKSIAELAGNPLLLTMMAILNRNQELPRDRAELYNQASRLLLHQWDVERVLVEDKRLDPKSIDYKDKQAMLRQVAHYMQTSEKGLAGNSISAEDLETILTAYLKTIEFEKPRDAARVMINQLRTRNFMLCFVGADYYAFVHRTFLEYFCASEFVWQFEKKRSIKIEDLKTEVFGKHWQDETWHEVLLLIAGMIEAEFVGEIIDYLMEQDGESEKFINLFLAAKCLTEVRNRSVIATTANQLLEQIKDLTKYDLWYYYQPYQDRDATKLVQEIRTQAVAAIATTWENDPQTKSILQKSATDDDDNNVRRAAIQALASNYKDDPQIKSFLQQHATDDNWDVRRAAIEALASNYKDDPQTKTILQQRATDDDDNDVRGAAIEALASNYKDDPQTKTFLQQRSTDESWNVRRAAIEALASNYKDDPQTKTFLQQRPTDDERWDVRRAAIEALASNYKDDPQTKTILQQRATDDERWDVRRAAIEALASNYKDDPQTKTFLQQRATDDERWNVRRAAIEALASNYKDDPQTKTFFQQRASDESWDVRRAAIEALASNYKDDPQTKTFLQQRASDESWNVRRAAIEALASNYKDDSQTKTFLQQRASDDERWNVRGAAIQALAKHYRNQPELFDIYYNCAVNDPCESGDIFNENPRRIALEIIIKQYPQHPQTLSLLRDRAENDPDEEVRKYAQKILKRLGKEKE
ncbi:HEAT repeat domain-containing protein [Nodularia sp. LEGE 06071]|uniref:HEAT repeat domain-containing protein n=2 Tax=unclassified Nodularia (in: cyanobacteria) TaxID=2656917 RepID=UPI00187F4D84|nr:HEAT repeat domain-containing protein [Nodularia sp. LEGE 06071]MBE9198725.1 HEAT repeat domain-containing protein [Nodularia sp. LEGE 06071]